MQESWQTRLMRWGFNFFPAFAGTGGRISFIAHDLSEVRVELPLSWKTRNYVGTLFGGSMYAVVDPIYMVMLIKRLGSDYVVWDKAASIRFLKPGRAKLNARFVLPDEEVAEIREALAQGGSIDRHYTVVLEDPDGNACAQVEKTLYIRRKTLGS